MKKNSSKYFHAVFCLFLMSVGYILGSIISRLCGKTRISFGGNCQILFHSDLFLHSHQQWMKLLVFYSNFNFNHSKYAVLSHCCFNYYILKVCISYSFPNFLTNLFLILTIGFFKIHYQSFLVLKTNGVIFFSKSQTLGAWKAITLIRKSKHNDQCLLHLSYSLFQTL